MGLTWRVGLADVIHGTCADATRHARPRGRAARAREAQGVDTWQDATRVHADTRVGRHVTGGRNLEGPRVSGPLLGVWGANANALPRPR